jgi:xanthine dehydrogenase accessory factor
MREIYDEVARRTAAGETVATATIIRTRGSTPREVGAKMLVTPTGLVGTVGGGCGEAQAHQAALGAIADGAARLIEVDLTEEISYDARGVCGGVMEMLIEPWSDAAAAGAIASALAGSGRIGVATVIDHNGDRVATRRYVVSPSGEPTAVTPSEGLPLAEVAATVAAGQSHLVVAPGDAPGREVFVEVQVPPPTLLVCGGGHIAVPLVAIGKLLGFRVVVLDDRVEFANAERFPEADEVIAEDFGQALRRRGVDTDTHVVLITRGHSHDVDCLLPIVDRPLAYVGMIGSRRRVFAVYKLLHNLGVPAEQLRRIHAPIGIDIAAETPAEIAVAIAAELVRVKNGGGAPLMSDGVADRYVAIIERGGELE